MRIRIDFAIILLASLSSLAPDANAASMPERFNVGGYIDVGNTTPHTFRGHKNPYVLFRAEGDENGNRDAARAATNYMQRADFATGMMLIDHGKIVFEAYKGQGNEASEFYSMSIAKSLTSLGVGKALCNGVLKSLDTLAGNIVPETKINEIGHSTIRQLLTMSSGIWLTTFGSQPAFTGGLGRRPGNNRPFKSPAWPMRLGQISVSDYLWGDVWKKAENKHHAKPGEVFVYKAADNLALGKIIERATGESFAAYFDTHVWQHVRASADAHWEADKDGSSLTDLGFQARLRDWGRIAIWIGEQVTKPGCFGDYLRQATTTQIKNARLGPGAGRSFDGYGYQWWTDNRYAPGFWGTGHAGQELAINPKTQKVLIKFSYRPNEGIYKIFREWNR